MGKASLSNIKQNSVSKAKLSKINKYLVRVTLGSSLSAHVNSDPLLHTGAPGLAQHVGGFHLGWFQGEGPPVRNSLYTSISIYIYIYITLTLRGKHQDL